MKLTFFSTILAVTILSTTLDYANAAGIAACTTNKDGTGGYEEKATRYCCQYQNGTDLPYKGQYSETYGDCRTGITGGNGIDQGKMTQCCSDYFLGFGSVAH